MHDVLLRVLQRAPSYRPERGSFRTYLLVAVRNEAVTRARSSRRHEDLERFAAAGQPDAYDLGDADVVEVDRLRAAVATLPTDQRAALELAYHGGLSHTEIAERLGVPLGTIKSRLVLAMRKLRTAVR